MPIPHIHPFALSQPQYIFLKLLLPSLEEGNYRCCGIVGNIVGNTGQISGFLCISQGLMINNISYNNKEDSNYPMCTGQATACVLL